MPYALAQSPVGNDGVALRAVRPRNARTVGRSVRVVPYENLPAYVRQAIARNESRIVCPTCDGGTQRERSLAIRAMDEIDCTVVKLSCWRSTCSWYAVTMPGGDVKFETRKLKPANVYREPIGPLSLERNLSLPKRFGLLPAVWAAHGWGRTGDTLVMPVLSPYGGVRGHVTRTFTKPKRCMTYKATAQPWLDWWLDDEATATIVVEDCLSACRLNGLGYNAVALLGTSMTAEQAKEIREQWPALVYLALDRDAFVKAQKLAKRFRHILNLLPICLSEDVKNMKSDDDIRALFGG